MASFSEYSDPPAFPVAVKRGYDYEVFLSFRGPDTRKTFTDHLYNDLLQAGIRTFRDNEELLVGKRIGDELLEAVNQSKVSIPIFSQDYVSSDWCLTELTQMVECSRRKKEHKIIPIFLDVTRNEVRNQTGRYHTAFQDLIRKNFTAQDFQKWRIALQTVAGLNEGFDLQQMSQAQGYQGKLSKMVVSEVIKVLKRQYLDVPSESLVGIDEHVDAVLNLVDIQNKGEARVVGIWGMAGAGKTTIAKLVYNHLIPEFDYCSFIDDIREKSKSNSGLESLQRQLISDLTRYNHEDISNIDSGKYMLKDRFLDKKVLILLDDVDRAELLEHLIPNVRTISPGSRIIVTTRDIGVLYEHQVKLIYQVTEMNPDDAFFLFCKNVLWQHHPAAAKFVNLSREMVKAVGGIPLAIKEVGSNLSNNVFEEDIWVEELQLWRKKSVMEQRLIVSVDALDRGTKEIFLDIACLFNGMDSRILVHLWKACVFSPVSSIYDLMRKSLITVGEDHKIRMHNQVRYLGRGIVDAENYSTPGSRSRVWCSDDGVQLLLNQEGTERVKAICLDIDTEEQQQPGLLLSGDMFHKMSDLEFLGLGYANLLSGQFKGRLLRLKWLSWHGDTVLNIPSDLHLKNLVVLDLSDSSIQESWIGWDSIKAAKKLQVVNLSRCHQLKRTPDFTSFPPLKRLILEDCGALATVDPSIGQLKVLESLNLRNCLELKELPQELGCLEALTELVFDGTSIQEIGGSIFSEMRNLEILSCKFCKWLTQLPDSIQFLEKLRWLFLDHCESLTSIPTSILQLVSLEELHLSHTLVELLPDSIDRLSNLKVLDISYSQIRNLPCSLKNLKKLEVINASKCHQLEGEISLGCTSSSLRRLNFRDCKRISKISAGIERLAGLQSLDIEGCKCLEDLPSLPSVLVNVSLTFRSSTVFGNLCSLTNLTELKLVQCMNLTHIPKAIEKLTKLQKLKFHFTNIETFPHEIYILPRLRQLCIEDCNKLEYLPQLPSSLKELHIVRCSSLKDLPGLSNLKKLASFSCLECPHLSHIPGLYDLLSLKSLKLMCNMVGSYTLKRLSSLAYLFLEGNGLFKSINLANQKGIFSIEVVDCESIKQVQGLRSLCLLKNVRFSNCKNLTVIEGVDGLVSLEKLDISGCEAVEELGDLSMLQNLKDVNLSGCARLKEIQGLTGLQSLERLDISECLLLPDQVHHPRAKIVLS